jgi:hypothetical protein
MTNDKISISAQNNIIHKKPKERIKNDALKSTTTTTTTNLHIHQHINPPVSIQRLNIPSTARPTASASSPP